MSRTESTTRFSPVERWRHVTPLERRLRGLLGADFASAYLFVLPTLIIMGGLIAYPFARAFYIGFTRTLGREIGPFVGLANYRALWADRFYRESVAVTTHYTVWSVAIALAVSLLAALLMRREPAYAYASAGPAWADGGSCESRSRRWRNAGDLEARLRRAERAARRDSWENA